MAVGDAGRRSHRRERARLAGRVGVVVRPKNPALYLSGQLKIANRDYSKTAEKPTTFEVTIGFHVENWV